MNRTTLPAATYGALFSPRSVAVVGASGTAGKATARPVEFLRQHRWAGSLYPVNPARRTVLGEPAWPSLDDLPAVPDHVLILTPADAAVDAVRQCARLGVPVATIVADGFLDTDRAGRDRRRALRSILDSSALRLLGPGSLGVANLHDRMALTGNAAFREPDLPAGDIFVASQSGSAIGALLSRGGEMGLGFRSMVSTGGELDLTLGEICHASVDDPLVASYALFLENIAHADDLRTFAQAAARRGKPVVAYKLGRSEAGARLAISHTGAIAGDDAVADAVLSDLGIARVTTYDALLEAQHIARQVRLTGCAPARPRVCVVSTTGGGGAMVVDCLASRGAVLDPPSAGTAAQLAALGIAAGHGALIDLTLAGATYRTIRAALAIVLVRTRVRRRGGGAGQFGSLRPGAERRSDRRPGGNRQAAGRIRLPVGPGRAGQAARERRVRLPDPRGVRGHDRIGLPAPAAPASPRPRDTGCVPAVRCSTRTSRTRCSPVPGSGARRARSYGPTICLITFRWPGRPR